MNQHRIPPEPPSERTVTCAGCGRERSVNDVAWIGDQPYCHPAMSEGTTCYMFETWDKEWML